MMCNRCDNEIQPGDVYYEVSITLTAEMDPEPLGQMTSGELASGLESALNAASKLTEAQAQAQVQERHAYVLCDPCRRRFRSNPLGRRPRNTPLLMH